MIHVFTKLFFKLLVSQWGIIAEDWCISIIIPLYKNKGDMCNDDNYRGISIASCVWKIVICCCWSSDTRYLQRYKNEKSLDSCPNDFFRYQVFPIFDR